MATDRGTFRAFGIEKRTLVSSSTGEAYTLSIAQPVSRSDNSELFPLLLCTDADEFFCALVTMTAIMQAYGEIPRFILAGIGYEQTHQAGILRYRDFMPHDVQELYRNEIINPIAQSALMTEDINVDELYHGWDASNFADFLGEDVIPLLVDQFPVVAGDINFYGFSAGATFGLFALLKTSLRFKRLLLASPATSFRTSDFGMKWVDEYAATGRPLCSSVYLSVGELEEFKSGFRGARLVTGSIALFNQLNEAHIPDLGIHFRMFPSESHATSWTQSLIHGLRCLFGPADSVPYWPEFRA